MRRSLGFSNITFVGRRDSMASKVREREASSKHSLMTVTFVAALVALGGWGPVQFIPEAQALENAPGSGNSHTAPDDDVPTLPTTFVPGLQGPRPPPLLVPDINLDHTDVSSLPPLGGGSVHTSANQQSSADSKNNQNPNQDSLCVADPVLVSTGTKIETSTDFALPGEMGLEFVRYYTSRMKGGSQPGGGWNTSIDFTLVNTACTRNGSVCNPVQLYRPDGSILSFAATQPVAAGALQTGAFYGAGTATLTYNANGTYVLLDEDGHFLTFNTAGVLQSIKDAANVGWLISRPSGSSTIVTHTNGLSYRIDVVNGSRSTQGSNFQVNVTDPALNVYVYQSTAASDVGSLSQLNSVTYPGSPATTISYSYAPPSFIYGAGAVALTGVSYNGIAHDVTSYDDLLRATMTSMADGTEKTSIVYSSNGTGTLASVTSALGHVTNYQYDAKNHLVSIAGQASAHCAATNATNSYDANGYMSSSKDNNGNLTNYTYNSSGQLQQTVENPGNYQRVTHYVWDASTSIPRLTSVTVDSVVQTSYSYDAQGRLASVSRKNLSSNGTANQTLTTTYKYTLAASGLVSSMAVTAPSSTGTNTTTSHYDSRGFLTSVVDALGHTTSYNSVNSLGLPGSVTSANGDTVSYGYDARGRMTSYAHVHAGVTNTGSVNYDAKSGKVSQTVLPDNEVTNYVYDADFKLISANYVGPAGTNLTKLYSYDNNADVTSVSFSRAGVGTPDLVTHTSYDELGRAIQLTGNHGQTTTITYDLNGNVQTVTDVAGHKTRYDYDANNRLQFVTDANGNYAQYWYDQNNQLLQYRDFRGLVTSYNRDGFGLLWGQASPDNGTTTYVYDSAGLLSSLQRNDAKTVTYARDVLGRVTSTTADGQTLTYAYDNCTYGLGRLCGFSDSAGNTSFTYNIEGTTATRTWSNGLFGTSTTGYVYDGLNRLIQISEGGVYVMTYNWSDDQVSSVNLKVGSQNVNVVSGATYDAARNITGWTYGNGLVRAQSYDSDGRITGITTMAGSSLIQGLSFAWDSENRLAGITNAKYSAVTQTFGYDALHRMTSATGPAPLTLGYDANGNRTTQVDPGNEAITISSGSNQLLTRGGHSYNYDLRGNVKQVNYAVSGTSVAYTYDGYNHLAHANRNGAASICETNGACPTYAAGTTDYTYNARGQLLFRNGPNTGFQLFGYGLHGELTSETTVPPGGGANNGNYYVYFNGSPVALVNNQSSIYYIHGDQLGRPEEITDGAGSTVWLGLNYSFDRSILIEGVKNVDIGFPGQIYDANTGNWNNGARDYASSDGRYLQVDPLGIGAGPNPYAYVGGNPLSRIDPLGLNTYTIGVNGALVFLGGGQGAVGIYFNPGKGCGEKFDFGLYSSEAAAVGTNVGGGVVGGVLYGPASSLAGQTYDANSSVGPVQGSFSVASDGTRSWTGGWSAIGLPGGASFSTTTTQTYGFQDGLSDIRSMVWQALNRGASIGVAQQPQQ